ncbi:MAG TPA: outer membrane beta-barrel protein [Gemmatimonadaceae bacterium]|nr:outer membrane beta-barrel protein [Gemmatimonadaceae bacterium]
MRGRIAGAVLVLGLLAFGSSMASAQGGERSNTRNLFLGLSLGGTSLELEDPDDEFGTAREQGGGASFRLGYGFTSLFALYIEGAAASIDSEGETFELAHGDIGARFHFGNPSRAFIPFLDLAFTARAIAVDDFVLFDGQGTQIGDLEISGSGISFGGGLLWFFNPKWALDVGLQVTTGEFDTIKFDNISLSGLEIDATSARLKMGVSWFPMSGR